MSQVAIFPQLLVSKMSPSSHTRHKIFLYNYMYLSIIIVISIQQCHTVIAYVSNLAIHIILHPLVKANSYNGSLVFGNPLDLYL